MKFCRREAQNEILSSLARPSRKDKTHADHITAGKSSNVANCKPTLPGVKLTIGDSAGLPENDFVPIDCAAVLLRYIWMKMHY